ncbi:MAG TPA: MATE family efflux transporter [Candidatus Polarisedimenticolaceae bacterium]|nr:MATE family efflux transporter [Candidatus Polarisedimenticolaceae bacterium]
MNERSVLHLSAPLVVSFWMRALVTFVDTIYAALLGDAAVATVGLTVPVEFLMMAVWVGLSNSLTSALSRAMGASANRRFDQYLAVSWRLVWGLSFAFTAIGLGIGIAAPHLGLPPAVGAGLRVYGSVLIAGSAWTVFWSVLPDSIVKTHHDTRSTMWAGICTNAINFGLNSLFLFVFHWGVFGIALSTVLGRIGGLAYALYQARRHERRRRAGTPAADLTLDPAPYGTILALAVPSALTFALMAVESGLVNLVLSRVEHPTESIAAYSIFHRVTLFCLQPQIAIGVALLPFCARLFGAGDLAGVRRALRQTLTVATAYSLIVLGPLALAAAGWLAARLTESPITREYTALALRLAPLACLAGGPFLLCRPVFEAMGRGRPGLVMAALRYLVLMVPLAWGGLALARALGRPPLSGVIPGLIGAAAVGSLVFWLWLRAVLAGLGRPADANGRLSGGRPRLGELSANQD